MHVHFITNTYPPIKGGVARSAERCVKILRNLGHEVTVSAPTTHIEDTILDDPHEHREQLQMFSDLTRMSELTDRIEYIISNRPPDVFFGFGLLPSGHVAVELGKLYQRPVVCSVRGNDFSAYIYRWPDLVMETLSRSQFIIFVANSIRKTAVALDHTLERKSTVILNSVDSQQFSMRKRHSKFSKEEPPPIIGTSGIIRWKKGWDTFLDVNKQILVDFPKAEILVAGFFLPEEFQELQEKTMQAGLKEKLNITGPLKNSDVAHHLHKMNVFLQCSYSEGTPNGVLEAMAVGLPVVACSVDGITEIIKHGETGYLVDLGDVKTITRRVKELLSNETLAWRIGNAARSFIVKDFSMEREETQLQKVLLHAIEEW